MRIGKEAKNFKADDKAMKGYQEAAQAKVQEAMAAAAAEFQNWVVTKYPAAKQTESGLWYVVNNPGTGKMAEKGHKVAVHYSGMLDNGSVFDNSYQRGEPIEFQLGIGQVIPGWDEGIALMKEGAKYTLIIPSNLGYGARGAGGVIPPNATLIFETELMKVY
jgi:peptidyl-prolyl cis-trans isomerase A (cyclophilin A)